MSVPAVDWPEAELRIADVARSRRGRHRDRALASWRRTRAIELRATGLSYEQIAAEVGWANKGTAHKVINGALDRREAEDTEFLLMVEVDRLNALQRAAWDRAMQGHVPSMRAVLRIIEARCKLLGLFNADPQDQRADDWPCCQGPATVVIREDDCRHQGCPAHGRFE